MLKSPAEFDLLAPNTVENPYPFFASLLREAPVYQLPGTNVYLVASAQLIDSVLQNQDDYSANLTGILVTGTDGKAELFDLTQFGSAVDAIANADEPTHSVHRRLVLPQLTARKVAAMEREIRDWSQQRIEDFISAGGGDWVTAVADPIPVLAMSRLVGLPPEDLPQLLKWAFSGGEILAGTTTLEQMVALGSATADMAGYLNKQLQQALQAPHKNTSECVLDELVAGIRLKQISEAEAVSIMVVLVGAAGESTSSLTGSAVRILAQNSDLQRRLRQQPSLIDAFIEEVVRLESPFKGHYRVVKRATTLGTITLPEQARVLLLWSAANRDPDHYAAATSVDLERERPRDHLGFGRGIHFCVGARLARLEAKIMLEELLVQTSDFQLTADPVHVPSIFVRRLSQLPLKVSGPA
ncbi:cytochrome P450 [Halieaceae bacterium IMCC14734]|uniref:Cytochrome P450 n=1 Tax=Candidatus Litorirhabdus singularis TaxID=2518993 RepID=A0ABT3TI13_9GAMM|nr:cytochrome P450 [Candidatus Litorirhabdus singularis]MCX2981958.1 cytochrome P450 [Candidatus Litorirhabdus singularis]